MKMFDNHQKINWVSEKCEINGEGIILSPSARAEAIVPHGVNATMKIIGRKISGDGEIVISLVSEGRIVLRKNITFSTKVSKELSIRLGDVPDGSQIVLLKKKKGLGRVWLERILIEDEAVSSCLPQTYTQDLDRYRLSSKYIQTIRVAIIVPYSIYGGGEVYLENILRNTPDSFDVSILYLSKNLLKQKVSEKNIRHVTTPSIDRLEKNLILNDYDCVIYYNSLKVYRSVSALGLAGRISSKIFEIYHSNFVWSDAVSKLSYREGVSAMLKVSKDSAEHITGLKDYQKIHVPTGIDTDRFARLSAPKLTPLSLGISDDKIIFGIVARLSPEKNVKYAIDLISSIENSHIIVVGDGPESSDLKRHSFDRENVTFYGHTSCAEDLYNLFDYFILTSKIEGMPISILEAMSAGLPIFTTDVGSIKETIGHLDGVKLLSGDLESDSMIINHNLSKGLFLENLRNFVEKNHKDSVASTKFFLAVIDGSLNYVYNFETETLDGEYI